MLAGLLLIGCMEYTVDATKDANLGADTADEDLFGDGQTDTTIDEDTGGNEEPTIEESVATEKMYANTSALYQVDPEQHDIHRRLPRRWSTCRPFYIAIVWTHVVERVSICTIQILLIRAICPLEIDTTALTFTSDGELIIGVDRALYTFDVVDCSLSILISNSEYETSGDIVGLPDGYLYWSVRGDGSDQLIKVNPRTGYEVQVGSIGEATIRDGYANEKPGFSGTGVIEIDPHTGWVLSVK